MTQTNDTTQYVSNFLNQLVSDLPKLLGVLAILLIGYIIGKVIAAVIKKALEAASLNQHLHAGKGGNLLQKAIPNPTGLISKLAFWLIFLFTISVATSALGIPVLNRIVNGIYAYIPNVIAALIIFLVASAISAGIATLVTNVMGDTPTGKIAAAAAPTMVMGLAVFMILNQLKVAPEIVTITYAGIVGTATLAFGLGGKDAASKLFLNLYESGMQQKASVMSDVKKGANKAKVQASELQDKAQVELR